MWAGGARCSSPAAPDSDVSAVRNVPIIDSGASFSEYFSIFDSEMDGQGVGIVSDQACTPGKNRVLLQFLPGHVCDHA